MPHELTCFFFLFLPFVLALCFHENEATYMQKDMKKLLQIKDEKYRQH